MVYTEDPKTGYRELRQALEQGMVCEVDHDTYWYYLEVIPPVWMFRTLDIPGVGRRPCYGFAEGTERITAFWREEEGSGVRYFAWLTREVAR